MPILAVRIVCVEYFQRRMAWANSIISRYTDQSLIRNFCIIAHIDHGKSTVADRILQLSGIVPEREMRDRFLDRMDIEQERGITIKSQAVRVPWTFDGTEYTLGMIDTPATSISLMRFPALSPHAKAQCCLSTRRRASKRRPCRTCICHRP